MSITFTSSLLPNFTNMKKEKAEHFKTIFNTISNEAQSAFEQERLTEFDAPVGDNSCKIRAFKIAALFEKKMTPEGKDLDFLIGAFFLTKVKKANTYDQTDPDVLKKIAPIPTSAAKDWIHDVKVVLSRLSVEFVQETVAHLEDPRKEILTKMVDAPFIKEYEKRVVVPNVHCMEILFKQALHDDQLLMLKMTDPEKTVHLFCKANTAQTDFVPFEPAINQQTKACVVIEALCKEKWDPQFFEQESILDILLTTAAQDPQYLSGKRSEPIPFAKVNEEALMNEQQRWEKSCKKALEKGISSDNPIHFLIQHIFCDCI